MPTWILLSDHEVYHATETFITNTAYIGLLHFSEKRVLQRQSCFFDFSGPISQVRTFPRSSMLSSLPSRLGFSLFFWLSNFEACTRLVYNNRRLDEVCANTQVVHLHM